MCLSVHRRGGGGNLPWMATYLGQGGGGWVPTLDGVSHPGRYLPWMGGGWYLPLRGYPIPGPGGGYLPWTVWTGCVAGGTPLAAREFSC